MDYFTQGCIFMYLMYTTIQTFRVSGIFF